MPLRRTKSFSGQPRYSSLRSACTASSTARATSFGSSTPTFSAWLRACAALLFIAVRVVRGAAYSTFTEVSASSRRSASENPRKANLLAQ
ncbi:hypothetical protein D9M71_772240 [compost metagenome]